jgi:hypothetical protein
MPSVSRLHLLLIECATATAVLLVTTGCGRGKFVTQIDPDGGWRRTATISGKVQKEGGMSMPGTSVEDIFVLPTAAAGWKKSEESKGDDRVLTFERSLAAGATLKGDLSLKGDGPDQLSLVNQVAVTRRAPNRIEYQETLRWVGSKDSSSAMRTGNDSLKPEDLARIRAALPPSLATDENAKAVAEGAMKQFMPALFGPGEPLLALGIMHPDLAERRIFRQLGTSLDKALIDRFGSKLTAEQRRTVVTSLINAQVNSAKPTAPDPSGPPSSSGKPSRNNNAGLTPLIFIVHGPGRIISTNGERDEFNNEVYWALYPPAATFADVVMTVVFDPSSK